MDKKQIDQNISLIRDWVTVSQVDKAIVETKKDLAQAKAMSDYEEIEELKFEKNFLTGLKDILLSLFN